MKPKLIFIYSVAFVYLVSIGLIHINPNFIVLSLISMGFICGFMANESFFNRDSSIQSRTREQIINSMCFTYRHDYWLIKESKNFLGGMTEEERKSLYNQMAKIFDNDIAPYVDLKCFSKTNESSLSVDQLQHLAKTSQPPEGFSADTEW